MIDDAIDSFRHRYGEPHYFLLLHTSIPIALTPDLLKHLWIVFTKEDSTCPYDVPYVAIADIIISCLCEEVGHELYEMRKEVRNKLVDDIKNYPGLEERRVHQISRFLVEYAKQHYYDENIDVRNLMESQEISALAFFAPRQAVVKLATGFKNTKIDNPMELLRLTFLVDSLELQLSDYPDLINYSKAIQKLIDGDISEAINQMKLATSKNTHVSIQGIELPIPYSIESKIAHPNHFTRKALFSIVSVSFINLIALLSLSLFHGTASQDEEIDIVFPTFESPTHTTVTSATEASDIRPNDWAFPAFQRLIEEYGIEMVYTNGEFMGDWPINRHEAVYYVSQSFQIMCQLADEAYCMDLTKQALKRHKYLPEDLDSSHWNSDAHKFLSALTQDTLSYENGQFRGDDIMSRGEMVALLSLTFRSWVNRAEKAQLTSLEEMDDRVDFGINEDIAVENVSVVEHSFRLSGSTFAQVTETSELSDHLSDDWSHSHVVYLTENFGCFEGYPDRTFRGDRAASRREFAAVLNACLDYAILNTF